MHVLRNFRVFLGPADHRLANYAETEAGARKRFEMGRVSRDSEFQQQSTFVHQLASYRCCRPHVKKVGLDNTRLPSVGFWS